MNTGCKPCMDTERQKLLQEISKVDFVLKELNLYLDTHPYDQQAMERFGQFNALKNKPAIRSHRVMIKSDFSFNASRSFLWES